jgi:tmRNA-binding protein
MVRESHQALIHNVAVKIYRHVVVHQIVQERRVKLAMDQILAVRVLHQWNEINLVCVHVFLNQTFQKM